MSSGRVDNVFAKEVKEEIKQVREDLAITLNTIVEINKNRVDNVFKPNSKTTTSELIKEISKLNNEIEKLKKAQADTGRGAEELDRLNKKLAISERNRKDSLTEINKQIIKNREETKRTNAELRKNDRILKAVDKTYQKLNDQYVKHNKLAREAGARYGVQSKEFQKASREALKYRNRIDAIDKVLKNNQRNVGNYQSGLVRLTGIFRTLVAGLGITTGVTLFTQIIGEAREVALEARGVEFAFDRIGARGVEAFNKIKKATRGVLSDLDIKKAIVEFDNFNLSLEQSDVLFEFLAIRAAQTGKSIDSLRDSLVEGLSKESKLRIDNLGISASELNAELEKTPDFVEAVANIAKREVAEAGDILDEASSSQAKWNASLENFYLVLGNNESLFGRFINGLYDIGSAIVTITTDLSDASDGFLDFISNLGLLAKGNAASVIAQAQINRANKEGLKLRKELVDLRAIEAEKVSKVFNKTAELYNLRNVNIDAIKQEIKALKEKNKVEKEIEDPDNKPFLIFNETEFPTEAEFAQDFKDWLNNIKKKIKEITSDENLIEFGNLIDDSAEDFEFDTFKTAFFELTKDLGLDQNLLIEEFKRLYGEDLSNFEKFQKEKERIAEQSAERLLDLQQNLTDTVVDLGQSVTDIFTSNAIERADNRIEQLNREYDEELKRIEESGDSEESKEQRRKALEAQKRKDDDKLRKQQEKQKKRQFLIDQGFEVGKIFISMFRGIAEANALAPATFGASLAWIPIIKQTALASIVGVLAQTIPKLRTGTKKPLDKDTLAITGDGGQHEVVTVDGKFAGITPKTDTLTYLPKGAEVFPSIDNYFENNPHAEYSKLLENAALKTNLQYGMYNIKPERTIDYNLMSAAMVKSWNKVAKTLPQGWNKEEAFDAFVDAMEYTGFKSKLLGNG